MHFNDVASSLTCWSGNRRVSYACRGKSMLCVHDFYICAFLCHETHNMKREMLTHMRVWIFRQELARASGRTFSSCFKTSIQKYIGELPVAVNVQLDPVLSLLSV